MAGSGALEQHVPGVHGRGGKHDDGGGDQEETVPRHGEGSLSTSEARDFITDRPAGRENLTRRRAALKGNLMPHTALCEPMLLVRGYVGGEWLFVLKTWPKTVEWSR